MKEKQNKDDYAKIKAIVNLYPKSERALVVNIARLITEVKISRAELSARHHIKIAQAMRELGIKAPNTSKQKNNPNQQCAIIVLEGGIPIHVKDDPLLGEYKAGFVNALYVGKEEVLFGPKKASQGEWELGGVHFEFKHGLPKCQLYFWVTWGYFEEEAKFKIGCRAIGLGVEPSQYIVKYTNQAEGFFAGFDMKWTVVSPNDYVAFFIKNSDNRYISHYYTTMVVLLD
jgi:hypothetical protein